jgi:ABC-2 type transport system ATP-binding protein
MSGHANGAPLAFEAVSHWYGDVVAVNEITCTVQAGITGLLGPNGAGKSTLLGLAAGLLEPSRGTVRVYGEAPFGRPETFARVALVPEREALPGTMTARAFVHARAALLGLPDPAEATRRALSVVELDTAADRRVGGFSKGMRQRVKLAAALVHEPSLVLLDEPFNGLDPRQRFGMMRLLEARAAEGTAVVLSSHILEEIEGIASRILVMFAGRLAASGDYRTLRRLMTDRPHTVLVRSSDDRALATALVAQPSVLGLDVETRGLTVRAARQGARRDAVRDAPHRRIAGARVRLPGGSMSVPSAAITRAARPSLLASARALVSLSWARTITPAVLASIAGLVVLPMLFGVLYHNAPTPPDDPAAYLVMRYDQFVLGLATPLIALLLGTSAFSTEADDGTLLYLVTTTTPRWWIVFVRVLFAAVLTAALSALAVFATGAIVTGADDPQRVRLAFTVASAFGGATYAALFTALALLTRRALVTGLGYTLLWEGSFANTFPAVQYASVRQWLLAIANTITESDAERLTTGPGVKTALVGATLVVVLGVVLGAKKLDRPRIARTGT